MWLWSETIEIVEFDTALNMGLFGKYHWLIYQLLN